jgi:hypothetical protein
MTAGSFPGSRGCVIEIESGNQYFHMKGDFMMDLIDRLIVRYCGTATEVTIPDEIEIIGEYCFSMCESICFVRFGSVSKLSSIELRAFWVCSELKMIEIPSSVTSLGDRCFELCQLLGVASFCRGSQLDSIPARAFFACVSLESIVLPSTVKTVGISCFYACRKLAHSPFPVDSEVVRIEKLALSSCSSLNSMFLASSVEFVGEGCFAECDSLSSLAFSSPSHLRELLDLPPKLSGFVSIPDSVEILVFDFDVKSVPHRTLRFGSDSRLRQIRPPTRSTHGPSFLQVQTRCLKLFRVNLEFEGSS